MDLRMYVLSFDMQSLMCIDYSQGYKTWIGRKHIKVGHTTDWKGARLEQYQNNYGSGSHKLHRAFPVCDGCGKDCQVSDHHHVIVEKTWLFEPKKKLNGSDPLSGSETFVAFAKEVKGLVKDKFEHEGNTEYLYKTDLDRVIDEITLLVSRVSEDYQITEDD